MNSVFISVFYPTSYSEFTGKTLTTGSVIENANTVSSSCNLTTSLKVISTLSNYQSIQILSIYRIIVQLKSTTPTTVEILNSRGQILTQQASNNSDLQIDLNHLSARLYFVN